LKNLAKDFDVDALYQALDAQRRARGLTWPRVMAEINRSSKPVPRQISASTITGIRDKRVIEGDGVLQMLRWLRLSPERFGPPAPWAESEMRLPAAPDRCVLRFDTAKIHAMLDARRASRHLTWKAVAEEIGGVTASSLQRYAAGGRTAFPHVMRIARWLEVPVARLVRVSEW
jgi:hypothetical protein